MMYIIRLKVMACFGDVSDMNYLVLLTVVHTKHLGITSRPPDSVQSRPGGDAFLCGSVL